VFAALYSASLLRAQYRFEVWTTENGLPQNIVRAIAQTPDGYLWLATFNGLARFDGVRFTVFDKSNTPGMGSNRISFMCEDRIGDLWLTAEGGQLTRYHQGQFHTVGAELGLASGTARALACDPEGHVWTLSGNTIQQWDEVAGRFVDVTPKGSKISYVPLRWESEGFWGSDRNYLYVFLAGQYSKYKLPSWLAGASIWGIARDPTGTLWIETIDGKQATIITGKDNSQFARVTHPASISYPGFNGHSWIIHIRTRLDRYVDYLSGGTVTTLLFSRFFQDKQQNLWLGTEGQGLYRLQKQTVAIYAMNHKSLALGVYPIFEDHVGAIWIGAWAQGLSRLYEGRFTNYGVADGLPALLVTALTEDSQGRLWIGTHGGLAILTNGHLQKPTTPALPEGTVVQAILQDRHGTLWFGSDRGLWRFKNGVTDLLTPHDGLASSDIRVIIESASGDLWFGGYGGLTRLHDGNFSHLTEEDGLPSNNIRSLYEDADQTLWIGTYDNGLGRLRGSHFTRYRKRDGLFSNGVFQILETRNGNLWMSSNQGIYRVNKQELNEFAEGKRRTIASASYGRADGMINEECNGGLWPAGVKTHDGKLLFPTQDGVAAIDPDIIVQDPAPPAVLIEGAYIDHEEVSTKAPLTMRPANENLEIEYTAPSFVKPEQIRFRYKLEGLDSNWIEAGGRRTAYYSHIPPGGYKFHVIAGNSIGLWNPEEKTINIDVLAPFYKTWWFSAIIFLMLLGFVMIAWRLRLSQLDAERIAQQAFSQELMASQERERKRVAAELHDGLGQRLVIINNLVRNAIRHRSAANPGQEQSQILEEISAETHAAIKETRDISYNLRPSQLDRLGLTKALAGVIRSVSESSGIAIQSTLDDVDDLFPEDLRINVYRIVQESLTNVMKHANATHVDVRIERSDKSVVLTVHDNGKGFISQEPDRQLGRNGFGLSGMAERAHSLGGVLKVNSRAGYGTEVIVEIHVGR
jgi:signal transduction histidine kinase/ligand-binding sensor domain-containing protein